MAEVIKIVGRTSKISAKDRIYEGVLEHILNGDYPANTIINEKDLIEKYILNLREVFLFVAFRLIYTTISNPQKLQRQHRSLRHRDGPYSLYRRVKN